MANQFSKKKEPRSTQRTLRNLFSAIFAISAVSSLVVVTAQVPVERARTEGLARRASERLQALQREADRLASDERTLLGDLRKFEIERELKAAELKRVDAEAAAVQVELDATAARMDALQASSRAELPELQQRL